MQKLIICQNLQDIHDIVQLAKRLESCNVLSQTRDIETLRNDMKENQISALLHQRISNENNEFIQESICAI